MFHVQLAGQAFTIDNHFGYLQKLCRDYLTDTPGEEIAITQEEIAREQTGNWPQWYLESLAVYRKICETLLPRDIVLFHCSALALDGRGYLFTAPSGTGKSTHARLWRERFGSRVTMINDDKPLLKISREEIWVYGTPFAGKEGLQTNTSAPVGGIIILRQGKENTIRLLPQEEAYPQLLTQTYRPKDAAGLLKTMAMVQRLAELPVYCLECTISQEAVKLAHGALTENV